MGTNEEEREDSLAPVSVGRLSVEEEVALMDKGKGGQVLLTVSALVAIAAAGVFWLRGMDETRIYSDLIDATSRLEQDNLQAFVHCTLPGTHATQIDAGDQLARAIEGASARMPAAYATTLRRCSKKLEGLASELQALTIPERLKGDSKALLESAGQLEHAALGYASALSDFDVQTDAHPSAAPLAEAWNAYADQHASFVMKVREAL